MNTDERRSDISRKGPRMPVRARRPRSTRSLATVLAAILVGTTTIACSRTPEEVERATAAQEQLSALDGVESATVEVWSAENEDWRRAVSVEFELDASSQAMLDVLRQVREIVTADGATVFDLALSRSEHLPQEGNRIYWRTDERIGPNVEVEGELWVRLMESTGSTSVQVESRYDDTLQIAARGWTGDEATMPTSIERYTQIVDLCDALWIDEALITAETDFTLSGSEPNAFTLEDFSVIDEVRALPFLAGIQVSGYDEGISFTLFPLQDANGDDIPLTPTETSELLAVFERAGMLDDHLSLRTWEFGDEATVYWPAT